MSNYTMPLNKLRAEDIDDKISKNERDGITIYQLRDLIREEKLDFVWTVIRAQIQIQSYTEQLEHIERKIKEREAVTDNGV